MKKNQHPGPCGRCGAIVRKGQGYVTTERDEETFEVKHTCWHDDCPDNGEDAHELPRWAVRCEGLTALGNPAAGVRFVDGEPPNHDAIPMNDTARRIAADWPAQPRRPHDEHVAEILARFGHTWETFTELGVLRDAWTEHVHWSKRIAMPEPLAADLRDALARHGVTAEQIEATRAKRIEGET